MSDELPQGWIETPLESLAANTKYPIGDGDHGQIKPATYTNSGIPYIRVGDMGWGKFEPKGLVHIPKSVHEQNLKSELLPGDILIAKTGATIGKCCIIPNSIPKANTTSSVGKVTINRDVTSPEWILYNFLSRKFSDQMWAVSHKTAQPGFNIRDLKQFTIPLAPRAEQQRIVAKLETLLGKVVVSHKRLAKISALLKRFRQSVLAAGCAGRLTIDWREKNGFTLEESWRDTELRDICSSITDGDHLPPPKQASGVPFLTIGNISSGRLDFSITRFVSENYFAKIKPDRIPKRGDTLYTVVGATIGIPVLVDVDRPFCFQRHIAILKPSNVTSPEYLHTLMGCPAVFREAWNRVTGSAQPTLPLGNLRTIPVSVPQLPEQQEIVRRVEGLFALADQLEERLAKARGQVEKLTPSLLARAFAGKLVPQDPTDEPAEKLLERLKRH